MTASITDDIAAGMAARNEGQSAVQAADVAVHLGHGTFIRRALGFLIRDGGTFTAETLRGFAIGLASDEGRTFDPAPNLIPAIIGGYASAGRIAEVGRVASTRPERRGSKISLWRAAS